MVLLFFSSKVTRIQVSVFYPLHLTGFYIDLDLLPNCKILEWWELKAFEDDNINVTEKLKCGLRRVENIVGKEENAGKQPFLLFPQCCQKTSFC